RLHCIATFCTFPLGLARYNEAAFTSLVRIIFMAFFSKLFKSKKSQTTQPADKERKLGIQSIHKTEVVRQDVNSIPDNELLQVILADTDADYCLEVLSKISNEEDALTIAMQHSVAAVR